MKPLHFTACTHPRVAPALATQAHESLRPYTSYLKAAIVAARRREARSACRWEAVALTGVDGGLLSGHKSLAMVMRYAKHAPADARITAIEQLSLARGQIGPEPPHEGTRQLREATAIYELHPSPTVSCG